MPPVVWACIILIGSSVTIPPVPEQNDWLTLFGHTDKLGHFSEYLIFGLLLGVAHLKMNVELKKATEKILGIIFIFAAFDEFHQKFIPGRSANVYDFVTDFSAAVFACILLWKDNIRHHVV